VAVAESRPRALGANPGLNDVRDRILAGFHNVSSEPLS
jgi:hypothetical protein